MTTETHNQQPKPLLTEEEVMRSLPHRQTTSSTTFNLPLSYEQAYYAIFGHFAAEIRARGRKVKYDKEGAEIVAQIAKILTQDSYRFGIHLCGLCGTGKTTLIKALQQLVNKLSQQGKFPSSEEQPYIVIKSARDINAESQDRAQFQRIRAYTILAIDDLGTEPSEVMQYGNIISPITEILEYRYTNRLYTIISTNLTAKQIQEKYGTRISDRLREMMHKVVFRQPSYRA